uniref:Uncharacterized protein n=1 Tax=Anguilla anguilla TaxID=7936 RepID=A0A0E9Q1C3_ANGAN
MGADFPTRKACWDSWRRQRAKKHDIQSD